MKLEDLKQDFPQMPEELRVMIEKEVQKQVGTAKKIERKNRIMIKKSFVAVLAAAMLLATTVFAGVIYQIRSEAVGKYGVKVKGLEEEIYSSIEQTQEFSDVRMEVSYLPEGMVKTEEGKYSYSDALAQGGVSICFYKMDTKDIQFDLLVKNVIKNETIQVGGKDGVYLELQGNKDGALSFNQRIYVAYPDFHYIMEMYVASDVSKQEALKIAEGIRLLEDTSKTGEGMIQAYSWSDYLVSQKEEVVVVLEENEWQDRAILKNTHKIGEAFLADPTEEEAYRSDLKQIEITVTDVQISDQIGLLDLSVLDKDEREAIEKEVDTAGKLLPTKVNYIKYGDGIHTLDKIVDSREVGQKLVYATIEYTNIGEQELSEVLFMGELVRIVEEGNQVKMYYREEPQTGSTWDVAQINSIANNREMWYYVHGGERGNNYITNLKPRETATVHMAWIVSEEELDYLYLSFDTYGSYEFTEHSLAIGYVDIRQ